MGGLRAVVLAACLPLPLVAGQAAKEGITEPPVALRLTDRRAQVAPVRSGGTRTGGGNIDVRQPSPDVVVITLTGAAVATDHPLGSAAVLSFQVEQGFEVVALKPAVKAALAIEARVTGLLRGGKTGSASASGGWATVTCGGIELGSACLPDRCVAGANLTVNDQSGLPAAPVGPGPHTLAVRWQVSASHPKALLGKAASAEFAPEPALDPLWVGGPRDPFRRADKKDFGFQVTLRVAEADDSAADRPAPHLPR